MRLYQDSSGLIHAAIGALRPPMNQSDKPSVAYWRDHSAGASRRRVTPMLRGNRPSTAACTSFGARNASEIVILTWRTLFTCGDLIDTGDSASSDLFKPATTTCDGCDKSGAGLSANRPKVLFADTEAGAMIRVSHFMATSSMGRAEQVNMTNSSRRNSCRLPLTVPRSIGVTHLPMLLRWSRQYATLGLWTDSWAALMRIAAVNQTA